MKHYEVASLGWTVTVKAASINTALNRGVKFILKVPEARKEARETFAEGFEIDASIRLISQEEYEKD